MGPVDTKSWKSTLSNPSDRSRISFDSIAGLVLIGLLLSFVQATWRWPLGIPGHHGLEWMLALVFARMQARHPYAALIAAGSAAVGHVGFDQFLPLAHDFKTPLLYLLSGAMLDLLYRALPSKLPAIVAGGLLGGIAFLCKPAVMLGVQTFLAIPQGMFRNGLAYPFLTHFIFGLAGGVGGALLALSVQAYRRKRSSPG